MQDGAHGGATTVIDLGEQFEVAGTHGACELDFIGGIQCVADKAVDFRGGQSCVFTGGEGGLGGQRQLGYAGFLREFGESDTGDGRLVLEKLAHAWAPCAGWNMGRRKPSGSSCMIISTGMPNSTASTLALISCDVKRVPSSSFTRMMMSG